MRTLSQKKNIHHLRRLLVNMAAGAAVGFIIRWIRGVEIAPVLCAAACGAIVLMKIYREQKDI